MSHKHLAEHISASKLITEINHASLEHFSGKLSKRALAKLRRQLATPDYAPTAALQALRATKIRFR
jgi:hypothetical protein